MPCKLLVTLMVLLFLDATAMSMIMPALPHLLLDLNGTTLVETALLGGLLSASFALMLFLCAPLVGTCRIDMAADR